jgi:eukaryotic-like serine/threonine-protein kinase
MSDAIQIGPYRIVRELGSGGMGDVFLAHDERLDRQVAIKRLRLRGERTAQQTEELRRRFRREAQLAAQVSHPGIVQIHDVLWTGDHDCIVMEYVPGATLRARLQRDVELGQVVAWSREIADAMAAAHDAGIIHRDLKTENILITPTDRAKITDFGIARRFGDEPLTADSAFIGTFRAVSPEQATRQPLDHRTDLFSFGVLLYEAIGHQSPFAASDPLETLRRVVHEPHRPIQTLVPSLPAPLAALIDQLLAKDPLLRPRDFRHVAAALAALAGPDPDATAEKPGTAEASTPGAERARPAELPSAHSARPSRPGSLRRWAGPGLVLVGLIAGALAWQLSAPRSEPPAPDRAGRARAHYVAVLAPKQSGPGNADLALRATSLRAMLLRALADMEGLAVLAPEEVDRVAPSSLRDMARALDADDLVSAELDCTRVTVCTVGVRRVRGSDAVLLWTQTFDVPSAEFFGASSIVLAQIRRGYADRRPRPGSADLRVSARDYQRYLRLYDEYQRIAQGVASKAMLQELAAIRDSSPGFIDAYLLEADMARLRYYQSRERADLERAQQLVEVARRMAPEAIATVTLSFKVALAGGELDHAARILDELARVGADQATLWQLGAQVVEQRGDLGQAVALLRQAAGVHPSWRILLDLADTERRHGESGAARQHLEQLLARSPDQFDAQTILAQIELIAGNLGRAIELYAALTRRSPGFIEYSNLGIAELLAGRLDRARDDLAQALATQPQNPAAAYNLADAELLLGEPASRAHYQQALTLLDEQHDESWFSGVTRAQALAHLGESARAVAELDRALRLAPVNNGDVAYAAATVYALVGDAASTVVHAGKALDLGYGAHWFRFPWFAALQRDPRFVDLVAQRNRAPAADTGASPSR